MGQAFLLQEIFLLKLFFGVQISELKNLVFLRKPSTTCQKFYLYKIIYFPRFMRVVLNAPTMSDNV